MPRPIVAAAAFLLAFVPVSAGAAHGSARSRISHRWAGYVVRTASQSFTGVAGTWVEPSIVCNRPESSSAFWVGLGGASSDSRALEQIGTVADCSDRALPSHSAWYELFPSPPVELPLRITPGDVVSAEVDIRAKTVTVALRNISTGRSFSTGVPTTSPESDSAEWIVEAPSACLVLGCEPLPLASFSSVRFTRATVSAGVHEGSISDPVWVPEQLEMAPLRGTLSARASSLSGDGSSFSVTCSGRRVRRPVVRVANPASWATVTPWSR